MSGFGLQLSVAQTLAGGTVFQPFAGIRMANLRSGDADASATGFTLGATLIR
jgi:hypothetical protein